MKWPKIKKILQIIVTIITTILGANLIQSCM
jgi:hypothetical protein